MDEKNEQQKPELQVELSPEVAEGTYANMAIVSSSPNEFILDFVRIMPNLPKAKVKSRIILSPVQAKRLRDALNRQLNIFEGNIGKISDGEAQSNPPTPINFGNSGMA